MTVLSLDEAATRSDQADWLELTLLCRSSSTISSGDVLRVLGLAEDRPEHGVTRDDDTGDLLEDEILEPRAEQLVQRLWAELDHRAQALGTAYPFELTAAGEGFTLRIRSGAAAPDLADRSAWRSYVACLLISALRRTMIQRAKDQQPAFQAAARQSAKVLQILSVMAAAHHVDGDAYWFGWPRIDSTTKYHQALERLVELLGHGKLKGQAPAWSSDAEKDGTVDLVAWKSFPDRTYGTLLFYGQVASGKNWRGKAVGTFIDAFFHDWFEDVPAKNWLPAMFIPFTLHGEAAANPVHTFEEVALGKARQDERTYGAVFDRLRITRANHVDETSAGTPPRPEYLRDHTALMAEVDGWIAEVTTHACED